MPPVTLHYTEALRKKATSTYIRRYVSPLDLILSGGFALLGWYLHLTSVESDSLGWLTILATILFVLFTAYRVYMPIVIRKRFEMLNPPTATLELTPATINMRTNLGYQEITWKLIKEVTRHDGFWFFHFAPQQYVTLPLDGMTPEHQQYILDRVKEAGGKVS